MNYAKSIAIRCFCASHVPMIAVQAALCERVTATLDGRNSKAAKYAAACARHATKIHQRGLSLMREFIDEPEKFRYFLPIEEDFEWGVNIAKELIDELNNIDELSSNSGVRA